MSRSKVKGQAYDFTASQTDGNVGNGDIFGLTRSVRNHESPSCAESILSGLDRFANGTDLVNLEQESVASLGLNGLLDEHRVGHGQIVTVSHVSIWKHLQQRVAPYPTIWKSEDL